MFNELAKKDRILPKGLYMKLKSKRKCESCKKKFNHPLEIHHKHPKVTGGKNTEENLMIVCKPCHKKLDKLTIPRKYRTKKPYTNKKGKVKR